MSPPNEKEVPKHVRLGLAIDEYQKAYAAHLSDPQKKKPAIKPIAMSYGLIPSTLGRRIAGKTHTHQEAHEDKQRLSPLEEQALKSRILQLTERGSSLRVSQVRQMAGEILVEKGDHKKLGINWVYKFLERHSELSSRFSQSLDKAAPPTSDPQTPLVLAPSQQRRGARHKITASLLGEGPGTSNGE